MTTAPELKTYYFHATHETVVAREPRLAAAFYTSHHQYANYSYATSIYTFKTDDEELNNGLVVATITLQNGIKIEICLEPRCSWRHHAEGTISKVTYGHAVPPRFFEDLCFKAMQDTIYEPGDDITDLYIDILEPLKEDFHKLTGDQLAQLARAIVHRRDNGDILPTLEYIIMSHYGRYMAHMHEIIDERFWDFDDRLDRMLAPSMHTGGLC